MRPNLRVWRIGSTRSSTARSTTCCSSEETQQQYLQALRRATKPGARLFMFEFGRHNVDGLVWEGLPADNFERLLPASGWRLDHLGTTTYQGHFSPEAFAVMSSKASPELAGG